MSEQYINDVVATLSGSITSGATTLVYSALTGIDSLPSTGTFTIRLDSELMTVTAVNTGTSTLTVTRGEDGTTAAAHTNGVTIYFCISKRAIKQMLRDRHLYGAYSSEPSAGDAQRLFLPTDSPNIDLDNGTTWNTWGPIFPITRPSPTGFSDVAATGTGYTHSHGSSNGIEWITASNGDVNGPHLTARVMAAPATPYSITAMIRGVPSFTTSWGQLAGLCFYNSTSGKFVTFGHYLNSGNAYSLLVAKYSSTNLFSANYSQQTIIDPFAGRFLKVLDDGTNFKFFTSCDGVNFVQLDSRSRTDFLTPDKVGWFIDPEPINVTLTGTLFSWAQGTS